MEEIDLLIIFISYWAFLALTQTPPDIPWALDSICMLIPIIIVLITMTYYCSSCSQTVIFSITSAKYK